MKEEKIKIKLSFIQSVFNIILITIFSLIGWVTLFLSSTKKTYGNNLLFCNIIGIVLLIFVCTILFKKWLKLIKEL